MAIPEESGSGGTLPLSLRPTTTCLKTTAWPRVVATEFRPALRQPQPVNPRFLT